MKGKIVACVDGYIPRTIKGQVVADAGGVGMIVLNDMPSDCYADLHLHPASHLFENATTIIDYIADSPYVCSSFFFQDTYFQRKSDLISY